MGCQSFKVKLISEKEKKNRVPVCPSSQPLTELCGVFVLVGMQLHVAGGTMLHSYHQHVRL